MAPVSSIDNQRPFLPQSDDNSLTSENESVRPFGSWLDQNTGVQEQPQPIKFKEPEQTDEAEQVDDDEEQQGTKLFAEVPAEKSKQARSLFKEKQTTATAGANKGVDIVDDAKQAETTAKQTKIIAKNESNAGDGAELIPQQDKKAKNTVLKVATAKTELAKSAAALEAGKQAAVDQKASVNQKLAKTIHSTPVEILKSTKPIPSQPSQVESMAQLKTNVKAIFNSLTPLKTSVPSDTSTVRVSAQLSGKQRMVSVDKMKPIRLTQATAANKGSKQDAATTIQHLKARKSVQLDPAISSNNKNTTPAMNAASQTEAGPVNLATRAQAAGVHVQGVGKKGRPVILTEDSKIAKNAKVRKRTKAKAAKLAAQQRNQLQHAVPDGTPNAKEADTAANSNQLQGTANQLNTAEFTQADPSSTDANPNNLFGKSETGASISTAKQSGKTAQAYASRSLSWLKTLSERTSQINRQDPNWKMLEMKLDKGDGEMTIKVMRKDEQVSISVQFTDDALRAHAESQSNQILESLKEQYGKDVNFSFTDKKESSMDSSLDQQAARRRRLRGQIEQAEKPVQTNTYNDQGPDQHLWIG